jgi:hypothetical protein
MCCLLAYNWFKDTFFCPSTRTDEQAAICGFSKDYICNEFIESVVLIKVTNGYGECTARARSAARHRPAARGTTARPNHRGMRPAAKKGMLRKICYCIVESSINSVPPDGPSAYVTCHKWPPHTTAAGLLTALLLLLLNRSNATSRSVCCRKQQRTTFRSSRLTTRGLWDPKDPSMS